MIILQTFKIKFKDDETLVYTLQLQMVLLMKQLDWQMKSFRVSTYSAWGDNKVLLYAPETAAPTKSLAQILRKFLCKTKGPKPEGMRVI